MTNHPITATKSHQDGHVTVRMALRSGGYGTRIAVQGSSDITIAEARALAAHLTVLSDLADAKVAKNQDAQERRKKWRDREVAAGRMRVVGW